MKNNSLTGTLFVVSAPSGAGKTSLVRASLEKKDNLQLSISHTTRQQRETEINHVHYHFIDEQQFKQMVEKGEFIEYAKVFNNYYGTAISSVQQQLNQGANLILEIDWQGAEQIKQKFPDAVTIFILPPSKETLHDRLQKRGEDSEEVIQSRMKQAVSEMNHYAQFDYLIVNDEFDYALTQIESIVEVQELTTQRQSLLQSELIDRLLED